MYSNQNIKMIAWSTSRTFLHRKSLTERNASMFNRSFRNRAAILRIAHKIRLNIISIEWIIHISVFIISTIHSFCMYVRYSMLYRHLILFPYKYCTITKGFFLLTDPYIILLIFDLHECISFINCRVFLCFFFPVVSCSFLCLRSPITLIRKRDGNITFEIVVM